MSRVIITAWVIGLLSVAGCRESPPPTGDGAASTTNSSAGGETPAAGSQPLRLFDDVTRQVGLAVQPDPGVTDDFPMPQIMGSGCALLDADGDGRLDLLVVAAAAQAESPVLCPLWLQQADGTFVDATTAAGLAVSAFGMGASTGDVDNDGDTDVLLTTAGGLHLYLNDGHARFRDGTAISGLQSSRWSTAAVFADVDRDGWLDLLVVNYVDYFPGTICQDGTGRRDYCGPQSFSGTVDRFWRHVGMQADHPVYEDVTVRCGLAAAVGKGLGAICTDITGDGRCDFYIANDMEPNRLWVQQSDGTFVDEADLRGCAVDLHGRPQASMGTAWADLDEDGRFDLFLTHLRGETNTLYRQVGPGLFLDHTAATGLGVASLNFTGFGSAAADLDLDGHCDLLLVNGRVMRSPLLAPEPAAGHWDEYAERNQVLINAGNGTFREVAADSDPFVTGNHVSRGLAVGDIDNDGDLDALVSRMDAPAVLFRNQAERKGHWLLITVADRELPGHAINARVTVVAADARWQREVMPNAGYLSSHDRRLHFGLGRHAEIQHIEVRWPDVPDRMERFPGGDVDQPRQLVRGEGILMEDAAEAIE